MVKNSAHWAPRKYLAPRPGAPLQIPKKDSMTKLRPIRQYLRYSTIAHPAPPLSRAWPNSVVDARRGTVARPKHFIARCHQKTGRHEEAARLFRLVYAKRKAQKDTMNALYAGFHLARSLVELGRYADAKSLMLPLLRGLDSRVEQNPLMRRVYAETLYKTEGASRDDVSKAATTLEDVLSVMRKRLGAGHPDTLGTLTELDRARMTLEDKFQQ